AAGPWMKQPSFDKWIQAFMASDPPRSKSVVMTVFGDAVMPRGGSAWLGSLIDLLAPFGISDRLVRTSVFRLAEEGWLEATRSGVGWTPGARAGPAGPGCPPPAAAGSSAPTSGFIPPPRGIGTGVGCSC